MSMEKPRRRDSDTSQITKRDIIALTWIAEQYSLSSDQLCRLLALYTTAPTKDVEQVSYSTTLNAIQRCLSLEIIDIPRKIVTQ